MEILDFINNYWPVFVGIGGFIAWLVGLQHTVLNQKTQIKALFELINGRDRRGD